MRRIALGLLGVMGGAALFAACSAENGSLFNNTGGAGAGQGGAQTSSRVSGSGQGGDMNLTVAGVGGSGSGLPTCNSGPNDDNDKDGWTGAQGDCNDCDPNVNPAAIDTPAMPGVDGGSPMDSDNNCDGKIDLGVTCDANLAIDSNVAMDAAKAVDLCKVANGPKDWGVISAKWVLADGSPPPPNPGFDLGHGMLSAFGPNVNVQAGKRMLGLSSGTARQPTDPGYMSVGGFDKGYTSNSPQGFPKESPACPGTITGTPHDATGVELSIRAPSNAHGFSFDFNFFTYEWPNWVCSTFNDFFVSILSPIPMGQMDGNISFDSMGNPVSVNNAFVEVCSCANGPPCVAGGKTFTCMLGSKGIQGTGFETGASTYWLQTKAPVQPGAQITIRWAVYDSGDGILDTTTLIDNWQWIATPGTTVGTGMVPTPK